MNRSRFVVTIVFILPVVLVSVHWWLLNKSYVFSQEAVASVATSALEKGLNGSDSFDYIIEELSRRYPGHIMPKGRMRWLFVNCGGWMGAMLMMHASVTEYVILFGTGINTSGHSGRYYANISDTVLSGSFRQWVEGEVESQMYGPGDTILHGWGEVAAVEWTSGTWMLEYGRGLIPSTLVFALADTVFSTTDVWTLLLLLAQYAQCMWMELCTCVLGTLGFAVV